MDLRPTDEQQALAQALHEFSTQEIRPRAREVEEAGEPGDQIINQLFEMGIATPVPEGFGGQGTFDALTSVIIAEEIAWGDPGVAFHVLGSGFSATLIDLIGSDEQRKSLLPQLAEGAAGTLVIAERDAGWDFTELEATARIQDGRASMEGTKYAVPIFDSASIRIVAARTEESLGLWLMPGDAPVVAQPEDKLGLRSAKTFKVILDSAEVPAEAALGGSSLDKRKLELALLRGKLLNAGICLGLARASLEYASDYAKERTAFGRPIGAFQGISFKIADRATELEAARLMAWKAAAAVDSQDPNALKRVIAASSHAVATAVATADDGVQILGGHGYMRDHPQELWYRDAMTLATLDSPSMIGDLQLAGAFGLEQGGGPQEKVGAQA
jgi:alkylation response protein AidB-like acyl-CoA dehydrogenase